MPHMNMIHAQAEREGCVFRTLSIDSIPPYRGTSLIRNRRRPPKDHHRSLGIGLL